ncbi:MAG: hypothetical protein JNK58_08895 [Phycisphaerae bacterium]|nr:hypothetical protein [Phycisphaerae bacterium]
MHDPNSNRPFLVSLGLSLLNVFVTAIVFGAVNWYLAVLWHQLHSTPPALPVTQPGHVSPGVPALEVPHAAAEVLLHGTDAGFAPPPPQFRLRAGRSL